MKYTTTVTPRNTSPSPIFPAAIACGQCGQLDLLEQIESAGVQVARLPMVAGPGGTPDYLFCDECFGRLEDDRRQSGDDR